LDPEKKAKLIEQKIDKKRRWKKSPKEYVDVTAKRKFDLSKFAKPESSTKITQDDDCDFDFFSSGPENLENMQKFQENAEEEEKISEIENPNVKVEPVDTAEIVESAEVKEECPEVKEEPEDEWW
jgi:hypothetical protein